MLRVNRGTQPSPELPESAGARVLKHPPVLPNTCISEFAGRGLKGEGDYGLGFGVLGFGV